MNPESFNYDFAALQSSLFTIDFSKERDTLFDEMFNDKSYGDYLDIFMLNRGTTPNAEEVPPKTDAKSPPEMEKPPPPNDSASEESEQELIRQRNRETMMENQIRLPSMKNKTNTPYNDTEFFQICSNPKNVINASDDGFIPTKFWEKWPYPTFGWCVINFFQKKNNANSRFLFKLYNALVIDSKYPELSKYVGVTWLTDTVIRVDKRAFGRLIGIKTPDNSLFHQQGNFPSHGFENISATDVSKYCPNADLTGVDFVDVRLLRHTNGVFTRGCSEEAVLSYKKRID